MKRQLFVVTVLISIFYFNTPAEAVLVNVYKDGYVEDYTRDQNIPPDGVPDGILETNALIASRGEFFDQFNAFNVDSRIIMTFDISPYAGSHLKSAYLTGNGTRVDNKGSLAPITGEFYIYRGDGLVGLNDFNAPADLLGSVPFQENPQGFNLDPFQLDVTSSLQPLFADASPYAEFRVQTHSPSIFINAGEVDPSTSFVQDSRWSGPQLALEFDPVASVPEPATLLLLGGGLFGVFRMRRNASKV